MQSLHRGQQALLRTGYTGKRSIHAGEELLFNFSITPTPVKGAYLTSEKGKQEHYRQFRHYHIPCPSRALDLLVIRRPSDLQCIAAARRAVGTGHPDHASPARRYDHHPAPIE